MRCSRSSPSRRCSSHDAHLSISESSTATRAYSGLTWRVGRSLGRGRFVDRPRSTSIPEPLRLHQVCAVTRWRAGVPGGGDLLIARRVHRWELPPPELPSLRIRSLPPATAVWRCVDARAAAGSRGFWSSRRYAVAQGLQTQVGSGGHQPPTVVPHQGADRPPPHASRQGRASRCQLFYRSGASLFATGTHMLANSRASRRIPQRSRQRVRPFRRSSSEREVTKPATCFSRRRGYTASR